MGRNYALDGDNGMKNNVHSVFSKGGREVRISLKYKLFNEKAFCKFQLHQTKKIFMLPHIIINLSQ